MLCEPCSSLQHSSSSPLWTIFIANTVVQIAGVIQCQSTNAPILINWSFQPIPTLSLLLNRAHTPLPLQCVHDWAIAHSRAPALSCFYLILHQDLEDTQIQSTLPSPPKGRQLRKPANLQHIEAVCQACLPGGKCHLLHPWVLLVPWDQRPVLFRMRWGSGAVLAVGRARRKKPSPMGTGGAQSWQWGQILRW